MENFYKRVAMAQNEMKCKKSQFNKFGGYYYRSCEDILEAAKPVLLEHGLMLNLSDEVTCVGDRVYVQATATLYDTAGTDNLYIQSTASAREAREKKGMDDSQITGTASSYARKYALNGLFNIDDTKDADTNEYAGSQQTNQKPKANTTSKKNTAYKCADCGKEFKPYTDKNGRTWSPEEQYEAAKSRNPDGVARCGDCRRKLGG